MSVTFGVRPAGTGITTTLPRFPTKVSFKLQADVKETRFPGALPLLLAFGRKANKLQIEGIIQRMGSGGHPTAYTKPELQTLYLEPLDAAVYKEVAIVTTGETRLYSSGGRRFTFAGITFEERPGFTRAYFYTAEFWEGSDIIEL